MRVEGGGPWTEAATLPSHLICFISACLPGSSHLLPVSVLVWVVLADLHWDTAMTLIALICQRAPVVAGEHGNISPKHCGDAMWILLFFSLMTQTQTAENKWANRSLHSHNTRGFIPYMTLRQHPTFSFQGAESLQSLSTMEQTAEKHVAFVTWPLSFWWVLLKHRWEVTATCCPF